MFVYISRTTTTTTPKPITQRPATQRPATPKPTVRLPPAQQVTRFKYCIFFRQHKIAIHFVKFGTSVKLLSQVAHTIGILLSEGCKSFCLKQPYNKYLMLFSKIISILKPTSYCCLKDVNEETISLYN